MALGAWAGMDTDILPKRLVYRCVQGRDGAETLVFGCVKVLLQRCGFLRGARTGAAIEVAAWKNSLSLIAAPSKPRSG